MRVWSGVHSHVGALVALVVVAVVGLQTEFTKMMAGFFGGEGFVLQRLTGKGDAFVKAR